MGFIRAAVLVFAAFLIACNSDDDGKPAKVHHTGCEASMTKCDIEETACVESLLDLAACTREDDTPPVPEIVRITTAEFADMLRHNAEDMGYGPTPWDSLLPKLQLLPEGQSTVDAAVDMTSQSVSAFYHLKNKNITIITDTSVESDIDKMYVVLHELTHYLQDRKSDLSALHESAGPTSDEHISLDALIEGEAVANSSRGLTLLMRIAPQGIRWDRFYNSLDESLFAEIAKSKAPLLAAGQFLPYGIGGRYVSDLWSDDHREDVDALFEEWPHAFSDWMLAETWNPIPASKPKLTCAPPRAPDGFSVYELDSFGAAGAFALLSAAGEMDLDLASKLRNDAFAVYVENAGMDEPSKARAIGVWRLRFSDAATLAQFKAAIADLDLDTQTFKDELAIRVSSDPSLTQLTGDALKGCPQLEDLQPMMPDSDLPAGVRQIFH
jgi:hypothetical protein